MLGAAAMTPHSLKSKNRHRILVAEDDAQMRSVIGEVLRRDGYDVLEAEDGEKFIMRIAARYMRPELSCDLIVCDIRMPGPSGLEVLRAIRDTEWRVPAIVMTAFGDSATRAEVEGMGAVLFEKPFDMADLRDTVASLLSSALAVGG
jgi:DNA-binding response OmpR family regulator